ncbi:MAG: cupin domain-containing protein [Pseudolysinimonas sp.]|uniref:cupin domain-containing protein n=1 Tax=Pseudolysinimonas sp. TaxID=2680009 RepID=UPI003C7491EF
MKRSEHRAFGEPDEVRTFPNGRAEILTMDGGEVGKLTFAPGWRWSNDLKPLVNTASCEAPHFQYHLSGKLGIRMDDGTEYVAVAGDVTSLPSGHDAWVIGEEDVVVVDWYGASHYAQPTSIA